ncbi:collagen-like protein [Bradyrhizobium sp. UFLA05-153]
MSGKSRYGGGFGSVSRHYATNTAAEETSSTAVTTAATVATDAAVRASWAQYVQHLVDEQIAALKDGVIRGLGKGINERLARLFDETKKLLQRELEVNSVKLEAALADVRAAKAEMREEIRAELRAEIADRVALIKQPLDGAPGPAGPPGKLEIVKDHVEGRVYYERDLVVANGALYQAERDTAAIPPHMDWLCITRAGRDGKDALNYSIEGTYDPAANYRRLSIVTLNGSSFVARHDDPGPCPGDGWQLFASAGRRGQQGPKGERGERGPMGQPAIVPRITSTNIDAGYNLNLIYTDGSTDSIPLRAAFEQFFAETRT